MLNSLQVAPGSHNIYLNQAIHKSKARLTICYFFPWCMLYSLVRRKGTDVHIAYQCMCWFKGILWDRRWSTPSIRIFPPHMLIWLRRCISNHETKQASKFQSDPCPNCFTIDVWNINCWRQQFISYLSYCFFVSHFTAFTRVL